MISHKFKRKERLKRKKCIDLLFTQGRILQLPLLRLYYLPYCTANTHQVLFSVPKKKFKKAVQRNTIKRRIREAYRVSKYVMSHFAHVPIRFLLGYVYTAKNTKNPTYKALLADVQQSITHLQECLQKAEQTE